MVFCDSLFWKDVARKLIRAALHRAAERHEVTYQDLLRMPSGERRAHHDDMTVVVFYFDHETRLRTNRDDKWELVSKIHLFFGLEFVQMSQL